MNEIENKQPNSARKWLITINNPIEKGFTHDAIIKKLADRTAIKYWCMADEVGNEEETFHTHVFVYAANKIRFDTMQKMFYGAHLDACRGTAEENRAYLSKSGKWENDQKHNTCVAGTFEEWGECPHERQGSRTDLIDLYAMIKDGMSNYDILEQNPKFMLNLDKIERARQVVNEERYRHDWRELDVTYIYGTTGTGKTRGVMERYGYESVFRVTDYLHPFDNYKGQDVIIFEEFRSSIRVADMLNYLDGYPLELPCRYNNKVACFTKVYIITNIPLSEQYTNVQKESPETWLAFLRRIGHVVQYKAHDILTHNVRLLDDGFIELLDDEKTPYDKIKVSDVNKL